MCAVNKQCGSCLSVLTGQCGVQGFAPHYDDIDAFALQLEGSKRCGSVVLAFSGTLLYRAPSYLLDSADVSGGQMNAQAAHVMCSMLSIQLCFSLPAGLHVPLHCIRPSHN